MKSFDLDVRKLFALIKCDAKSILRDPMLLSVVVMAALPSWLFYLYDEVIDQTLEKLSGEPATVLHPFIISLPGLLLGWVNGLLVVENREEGALASLGVTPLGKKGLLFYRIVISAGLSFLITVGAVLLLPIRPILIPILPALVALQAAAVTIALPRIANNTVEALAYSKFLTPLAAASLMPLIGHNLKYLGVVLPTFWVGELTQIGKDHSLISSIILAAFCHLSALLLACRKES